MSELSRFCDAHLTCSCCLHRRFLEAILMILAANDAKNLTQFKQIGRYEDLVVPATAGGAAPCACIAWMGICVFCMLMASGACIPWMGICVICMLMQVAKSPFSNLPCVASVRSWAPPRNHQCAGVGPIALMIGPQRVWRG